MKNENDMTDILFKQGWINSDNENEWTKAGWTIRFYDNLVEVYNDSDLFDTPKYFMSKRSEIDLETILDEIF